MATLFDLVSRTGVWTELQKHLEDLESQVGSTPGEPACGCNAEPCRKRTLEEHRAGIESTAWARCGLSMKAQVLRLLYPEESGAPLLRMALLRLQEGESQLLRAWGEAREMLIQTGLTTKESITAADEWVADVTSATIEAVFPWSVIEPKLRALP